MFIYVQVQNKTNKIQIKCKNGWKNVFNFFYILTKNKQVRNKKKKIKNDKNKTQWAKGVHVKYSGAKRKNISGPAHRGCLQPPDNKKRSKTRALLPISLTLDSLILCQILKHETCRAWSHDSKHIKKSI